MQHLRVGVQGWIDESDRALADGDALLVDPVEDGSEHGCGRARAADQGGLPVHDDHHVITDSSEVGIAASAAVVDAAVGDASGGVVGAGGAVGLVRRVGGGEIVVDCRGLVTWLCVDVAEAAS